MLGIEVGILAERHIHRFHTNDAVESQVVEQQVGGYAAEEEPTVAKLFEQVGAKDEL